MMKFSNLFSEIKIRNCTYKNRIIASPITANQIVRNGCITQEGIESYENKARGGFAQVTITESFVDFDYAARHDHGLDLVSPNLSSYHLDTTHILTSAIHTHDCLAFIQFNHVGMVNDPSYLNGKNPIGPSHTITPDGIEIDAMDEAMMRQVAENFAKACRNAQSLGFDGVNLHGGHGWLLSQFVSPLTNKRTDKYGGSMKNRARFPIMVLDAIRRAVGENFIFEYRVSAAEGIEGGMKLEDTIEYCKLIQDKVDIIHVTNGIYHRHVETKAFSSMFHPHGCNVDAASKIKAAVSIPVAVVGGINDPVLAEEIIASGKADFVALGRQQYADPEFPLKALEGREDEIAPCLRCSCFNPLPSKQDDRPDAIEFLCTVNPKSGQEYRINCAPHPRKARNVLVVGGGPGGLYAAITAAERGHNVTLAEKESSLGGLLKFTDVDVHKNDLRRYKDSLIVRAQRAGVNIELNTEVTPDYIRIKNPDKVIAAVGSTPIVPPIKGIENSIHALGVYDKNNKIGKRVIIIGGGLIGCETGLHLAELGHKVHVIEMMNDVARDAGMSHKIALMPLLDKMLTYETEAKCTEIEPNGVKILDKTETERFIESDTIIYAIGMKPNKDIVDIFRTAFPAVKPVGDCVKPQKVLEAVRSGMFAALDIL